MQRLSHLRAVAFILAFWIAPALAQTAVLQVGGWTPGHLVVYTGYQGGQPFVNDAGPASGNDPGQSINEFSVTATGVGNPPFIGQGSGPDGAIQCAYDGPVGNAYGWHYLCLSPYTALGGGEISYGAAGAASPLPLYLKVNGVAYSFPFLVGGILGPPTTTVGHLATWTNGVGTLIADGGPAPTYSVCGANNFATGFNASGVQQCAQPAFSEITGTLQAAQSPAYSGDVSSVAGSLTTTLATVNSNVGTYGGPGTIPVVTVNGKGLITAVSTQQTSITGEIRNFAMATCPTGWHATDGSAVSRTTYANLFTAIGTTYGAGDGSTTFNLPDGRGYFVRTWDNGAGRDSGRALGSTQGGNVATTAGTITSGTGTFSGTTTPSVAQSGVTGLGSGATAAVTFSTAAVSGTISVTSGVVSVGSGSDTRPINIAYQACIAF